MPRRKRRRIVTGVLSLLTLSVVTPCPAATLVDAADPDQRALLQAVQRLHDGDHASAHEILTRYMRDFPDDPLGPLLRLKVQWWRVLEGRDPEGRLDAPLQEDFELLQRLCEARLQHDDEDVRALYALGEAWCALGRLEGLRGHAWSTLRHHQNGTPYLEKAHELAPELPEPLVSLGVYQYYASRAPGFLRFLARVFRLRADRERGLRYLRTATEVTGIQQAEAAFFLLEILTNVEDEYVEALPLALRFHAKHPDNLGFRIPLSATQIAWGRPDAALELLRPARQAADPHRATAARFFVARVLGMTGRAERSARMLESFSEDEVRSVAWLPAWHPYYLGAAYTQLGRSEAAEVAYRTAVAAPRVADSQGYAERALNRRRSDLDRAVSRAQAALCWRDSIDVAATQLRQQLEKKAQTDTRTRVEAGYLLGCLDIERGAYGSAIEALIPAVENAFEEETALLARPRVRLLQALLWAGRFDEAHAWARRFEESDRARGRTVHLELLVQVALHPGAHTVAFAAEADSRGRSRPELFRLRDIGFTSVHLELATARGQTTRVAMRLEDGFWQAEAHHAGAGRYRFVLESSVAVPDPARTEVGTWDGQVWSLLRDASPHS